MLECPAPQGHEEDDQRQNGKHHRFGSEGDFEVHGEGVADVSGGRQEAGAGGDVDCVFFYWYGDHRDLHSFPTRRSSDLPFTVLMRRSASSGSGSSTVIEPLTVVNSRSPRPRLRMLARMLPLTVVALTGPPSDSASTPPLTDDAFTSPVAPRTSTLPLTVPVSMFTPRGSRTVNSTSVLSSSSSRSRSRLRRRGELYPFSSQVASPQIAQMKTFSSFVP